jgi:hypothetical protein
LKLLLWARSHRQFILAQSRTMVVPRRAHHVRLTNKPVNRLSELIHSPSDKTPLQKFQSPEIHISSFVLN